MFESLRRRKKEPQLTNKGEVGSIKSERDILIDARIDMHNSLYEKNNKYGGPPEKWPKDVREKFDKRKKWIEDEIAKIEGEEK